MYMCMYMCMYMYMGMSIYMDMDMHVHMYLHMSCVDHCTTHIPVFAPSAPHASSTEPSSRGGNAASLACCHGLMSVTTFIELVINGDVCSITGGLARQLGQLFQSWSGLLTALDDKSLLMQGTVRS